MRLFMTLLAASMPLAAASAQTGGDPVAGKADFARCSGCHSVDPGQTRMGPSLAGIVGRPVASVEGYQYSEALAKARGTAWTTDMLSRFLADPAKMYPGTRMPMAVKDDKARADIVAYLRTQSK